MKEVILRFVYVFTFAGVVLGTLMVLGFISYVSNSPFDDRKFDKAVWVKSYDHTGFGNPRVGMIDDLKNNYLKDNMTKKEVIKLLGKPSFRNDKHSIFYFVGLEGFAVDPGYLGFEFNSKNKLVKYYLIEI